MMQLIPQGPLHAGKDALVGKIVPTPGFEASSALSTSGGVLCIAQVRAFTAQTRLWPVQLDLHT